MTTISTCSGSTGRSGEILKMLEETGELENTLVVMSGDNGLPFPALQEQSL